MNLFRLGFAIFLIGTGSKGLPNGGLIGTLLQIIGGVIMLVSAFFASAS